MNLIPQILKDEVSMNTPSRRGFMASAVAAALGIAIADVLDPGEFAAEAQTPAACATPGEPFVPVTEFISKNKTLAVNMDVTAITRNVAAIAGQGYQCRSMRLRYYAATDLNGAGKWPKNPTAVGPGPVLRMRVGETAQIHMQNLIDPSFFPLVGSAPNGCDLKNSPTPPPLYPYKDTMPSCFHEDNVTNLHYHGTHVTPDGHGDNVMVDVYPKGHVPVTDPPSDYRFPNTFTIPLPPPVSNNTNYNEPLKMGQAPGTHWYHAHKHGSVALQLLNGMAGAFIIEGEFDDQLEALMPGLRKTEKVLVIQQIGETITIQKGDPLNTCAGGDPLPLVNGQLQPTIEIKPGEIQRWRIVNATMQQVSHLTYRFLGEDVYAASKGGPFPANPGYAPVIRQIAYDGIQLAPERYNDPNFGLSQQFTIAPGNRVDILVQAPATVGKSLLAFRLLHGPPPAGCQPNTINDLFLVKLTVDGSPVSPAMNFPTSANYPAMPFWLSWNESDPRNTITETRTLLFNQSTDASARPAINGKAFDNMLDTTQLIHLNTAEAWTLKNNWVSSIHPFHIHVNPFQILEVFDPNAATPLTVMQAPYIWRDTIAIPAAKLEADGVTTTNGYVKIRSRFVDFPGTFVLHCHILDHEDRGMMQKVIILAPNAKEVPAMPMHH